ncbi:FecR domain-containing protein [Pseudoduganella sp. GCM10020061]|uniref:FecR family protein n=1 Tax=Pseudoduganella sp. GCM10020061 TaxID=3317345 RepID=UPI003634CB48
MWSATFAWAGQVVGTVRQLSGPLIAKKADGKVKVLALRSEVEQGDTLVSEKNTYALIKFIDNSEITLRPDSSFKIESFAFDEGKPDGDTATFNLVKGGLRQVTGLLGKRSKEKFSLKTPTATIGIRGTTFIAHYVPPPPAPPGRVGAGPTVTDLMNSASATKPPAGLLPPAAGNPVGKSPAPPTPAGPSLMPGLHLTVADGAIIVTNNGGSMGFQAGQFGYVPNVNQPPVIVPSNPNIQFVPPPSFNAGSGGPTASNTPGQGDATDCIVR